MREVPFDLYRLAESVANETDVKITALFLGQGSQQTVGARRMLHWLAVNRLEMPIADVAEAAGQSVDNIRNALRLIGDLKHDDALVDEQLERIWNHYTEELTHAAGA